MDNGEDEVGRFFIVETTHDARDGNHSNENHNGVQTTGGDERDANGRRGTFLNGLTAKMPVEKHSTHYNMNHPKRGFAIIFNHEVFEYGSLKPRAGTMEDARNLEKCLTDLEFEVHVHKDLKKDELEHIVESVSKMDHTYHDCILIVTLSHGEADIVYAKDKPYKSEFMWSTFTADKCPTLAGKPKLFFFQACQGDRLDPGIDLIQDRSHYTETDGEQYNSYRIPWHADFLVVYSTVKGFYSWRNTTRGSWFIQVLCDELSKNAYKYDLMTLLTFVSRRVATDYESNVPDSITMHRQKQIPCIMSMLTRLIQFTRPEYGEGSSK